MPVTGVNMLALANAARHYSNWNPSAQGFGPTTFYPLQGAVVPFAPTEAARKDCTPAPVDRGALCPRQGLCCCGAAGGGAAK